MSCGHANPERAKFCLECGAARTSGVPHVKAGDQLRTPPHLADKIRQARSALEGERKQVTVLFADVKGSMELAERLDPEEFSRIMERFCSIAAEGVERFEGFVDKFTGDGIMALFGAPIAHEDHAQRACHAALHLRAPLKRYADELWRSRGIEFSVRMGINSGTVVVGKIRRQVSADRLAGLDPFDQATGARPLARLRGDERAAEREIEQAGRLYAEMGATAQLARLAER